MGIEDISEEQMSGEGAPVEELPRAYARKPNLRRVLSTGGHFPIEPLLSLLRHEQIGAILDLRKAPVGERDVASPRNLGAWCQFTGIPYIRFDHLLPSSAIWSAFDITDPFAWSRFLEAYREELNKSGAVNVFAELAVAYESLLVLGDAVLREDCHRLVATEGLRLMSHASHVEEIVLSPLAARRMEPRRYRVAHMPTLQLPSDAPVRMTHDARHQGVIVGQARFDDGTHLEVAYLSKEGAYRTARLRTHAGSAVSHLDCHVMDSRLDPISKGTAAVARRAESQEFAQYSLPFHLVRFSLQSEGEDERVFADECSVKPGSLELMRSTCQVEDYLDVHARASGRVAMQLRGLFPSIARVDNRPFVPFARGMPSTGLLRAKAALNKTELIVMDGDLSHRVPVKDQVYLMDAQTGGVKPGTVCDHLFIRLMLDYPNADGLCQVVASHVLYQEHFRS